MRAAQDNDNAQGLVVTVALGERIRCMRTDYTSWINIETTTTDVQPADAFATVHLAIVAREEGKPVFGVTASEAGGSYGLRFEVAEGPLAEHLMRNLGTGLEMVLSVDLGRRSEGTAVEVEDFDIEIRPAARPTEAGADEVDTQGDWLDRNL